MTNAMTAAYDDATADWDARVAADQKLERSRSVWRSSGLASSPHGEVVCILSTAQGSTTFMRPHFRKNWKLDGKAISAAKLEALFA
jgi:hypothetical protein